MVGNHPFYVMIKPTAFARACCVTCRGQHGLDDSYEPGRLHSTILRLGLEQDRTPAEWLAIVRLLAEIAMAPFDVAFDTLDGRLLRGASASVGAARLHHALARHLGRAGLWLPPQGFWLHLSLAYRGRDRPRTAITPIGWQVEEFLLIRSIAKSAHLAGTHDVIGAWRLVDRQLALAL